MLYFISFQVLGRGWVPVVLNSQLEADFIRKIQEESCDRPFCDRLDPPCAQFCDRSYWIGGSTNTAHLGLLNFSDYRTDNRGISKLYST